jgi:hypothetical protein
MNARLNNDDDGEEFVERCDPEFEPAEYCETIVPPEELKDASNAPELNGQQDSDGQESVQEYVSGDDQAVDGEIIESSEGIDDVDEHGDRTRIEVEDDAGAGATGSDCVADPGPMPSDDQAEPADGVPGDDGAGDLHALVSQDDKPVILIEPGHTAGASVQALRCLAATGRYFDCGGKIVAITRNPSTGGVSLRQADQAMLATELDGLLAWKRRTATGKLLPAYASPRVCKSLASGVEPGVLPALSGLAHQPFLRSDGTLCCNDGYDVATGLLAGFCASDFNVPAHPTREQAEAALDRLDGLLEEFAFDGDTDRAAALSAILTAVARPTFAVAPLFHVTAHQAGTGKSYLCKVISAFACAQPATAVSFPHSQAECKNVLLAGYSGAS